MFAMFNKTEHVAYAMFAVFHSITPDYKVLTNRQYLPPSTCFFFKLQIILTEIHILDTSVLKFSQESQIQTRQDGVIYSTHIILVTFLNHYQKLVFRCFSTSHTDIKRTSHVLLPCRTFHNLRYRLAFFPTRTLDLS
jgi:hypothetical protein